MSEPRRYKLLTLDTRYWVRVEVAAAGVSGLKFYFLSCIYRTWSINLTDSLSKLCNRKADVHGNNRDAIVKNSKQQREQVIEPRVKTSLQFTHLRRLPRTLINGKTMSFLAQQTAQNLTHQHLWANVETQTVPLSEGAPITICTGTPPEKLHPDDKNLCLEYIVPSRTEDKWDIHKWSDIFQALRRHFCLAEPPRRIVMSMVTEDSTIVYYFVNKGLTTPRKN